MYLHFYGKQRWNKFCIMLYINRIFILQNTEKSPTKSQNSSHTAYKSCSHQNPKKFVFVERFDVFVTQKMGEFRYAKHQMVKTKCTEEEIIWIELVRPIVQSESYGRKISTKIFQEISWYSCESNVHNH